MSRQRIMSLWFPRLGAERVVRKASVAAPFAVTGEDRNTISVVSLCPVAQMQGVFVGQALSDARVLCPGLVTVPQDILAQTRFLERLTRWAGKFSPWVAGHPPAALMLDISGCAHLFGGEEALAERITQETAKLRLTVQIGIGDTVGSAWALARYSGAGTHDTRNGDAIEQEARATRSRAAKRRHWERGGAAPLPHYQGHAHFISPPGAGLSAIADLPISALRITQQNVEKLARLGLRKIADLEGIPRASIGRRFGADVLMRLDQAAGIQPEPVSPSGPPLHFATRLSLPDPIGLEEDIKSGISRILPPLCEKLRRAGRGARGLRLVLTRTDHQLQVVEVKLARPSHDPARIHPLLELQLPSIDPGFGIDMIRLEAYQHEPLNEKQHEGFSGALTAARRRRDAPEAYTDLISRLGARIGLEAIVQAHPSDSHIPEKSQIERIAGYSENPSGWRNHRNARPMVIFAPEPLNVESEGRPPERFVWRRQKMELDRAFGPERIAPEWWLDDPNWRNGTRDYWRVTTQSGDRLWLYQAHGGAINGGWFCHGSFG